MAPNVTLHFFAANDINGDVLHEITDEDSFFREFKLNLERDGLGSADLLLSRSINFAGFASGTFQPEVFVRVLVHAYSDTVYYPWAFSLGKRQQVVVDRDEKGAETFRFGGPGPKFLMQRHALGFETAMAGDWNVDTNNGVWRWTTNASVGQILNRVLNEDQARTDPSLPFMDTTFNASVDSNGVAWADLDVAEDELYTIPIGQDYLTILHDLGDVLDLSSWIDLGTVASPAYDLNVIQGGGDDNMGSSFGAGVCLLKEGVNITNDSLTVEGSSQRKASHVIVEGRDGHYAIAERPAFSPGDYVKYAFIEYQRSTSAYWLEKAGIRWLKRQDLGEREITVEVLPGADDASGLYFPAPDRVLWLDNLISVDTSADGTTNSQLDIAPSDEQLVTAIELSLGPAGDTATADSMAKSWDIKAILNRERSATQKSSTSGARNQCCGPNHPQPPTPGTVTTATGAGTANNDADGSVSVPGGTGGLIAVLVTNSVATPTPIYRTASSGGTDNAMSIIGSVTHPTGPSGTKRNGNQLFVAYLASPPASGSGPSIEWGTAAGSQFGSLKGYWTTPSTDTPTVITASGTSATASVTPTGAGAEDMVLSCAGSRTWSLGDAGNTPVDLSSVTDDWAIDFNNSAGQNDGTWFGGHLAGAGAREVNMIASCNWVAAAIILHGTGGETGDETEPIGGIGSGDPGDSPVYSPIDHIHEHGLLSDDELHYHDVSQIEGLPEDLANIEELATTETDTDLVLAPDGAGGVEWVTPAAASGEGVGPILISDTPSTPLVFADLIQNEAQDDLVYADL